ncbi:murein transglycosylase [Gilliamella sp. B2894]|uniref:murein transglycosylase n=1 Tax=unclassified Gilliamella TaxID=2685620 RepID=UPI00226ACEB1|nr:MULTISPECIES: murein transglycosylase [unclassified Gilliamella]MCX8656177.1 murein transglycosylase [Gilliamella sp. B2894]MCX8693318.1 murein transglycosylase [Gilliamella sp. B2881]MCX8695820.1 murein transglycosylase [Gilliamella sp. B2828]
MKLVLRYLLIISLVFTSNTFANNSQKMLRENYQKWINSYQSLNFQEQKTLLATLKNYPLYPYAAVQFFQKNIKVVPPNMVREFVKKYQDFPLTNSLTQSYLRELTNRQDWDSIISFPKDNSIPSNCLYQYALLKKNDDKFIFNDVKSLWLTGKELSSACDPLLDAWTKIGKRTNNLILLRIELAVEANNLKLARHLANLLDERYTTTKSHLLDLFDNPRKLEDFSKNIKASSFTKKIILASFSRLTKVDMKLAETLLPQLINQQKLNENEQSLLQKSLASVYFNDSATDEQIKWRDNYIAKSHDSSLVEKRIRIAIDENNYKDIDYWLAQLTPEDQLKEDWQYWKARVLLKNNQKKEANGILQTLTTKRGFYGMISAQALNQYYSLNNQSQKITHTEISTLKSKFDNKPFIKRINELRSLGMLSESSREWRYMLNSQMDNNEYPKLAQYALHKGWGDLSIQATIAGKLWNNWTERLPIMYRDLYHNALKDKAIPFSYALAISRQESALDTTVQSSAGARGLMQLMPATAKETAKKMGSITYVSSTQLFDPKINIQLGSYYLNSVYLQNDNNRILSSAAYNAGPNRVKGWLKESGGKLDAVAFIDSIPFTETRNYVKNVLVYDYIYQMILGKKNPQILTQHEFNKQY